MHPWLKGLIDQKPCHKWKNIPAWSKHDLYNHKYASRTEWPGYSYTLRSLKIAETMTYGQIRWRLTWEKFWARCRRGKKTWTLPLLSSLLTTWLPAALTEWVSKVNRSIFTAQIQPNASELSRWHFFSQQDDDLKPIAKATVELFTVNHPTWIQPSMHFTYTRQDGRQKHPKQAITDKWVHYKPGRASLRKIFCVSKQSVIANASTKHYLR